MHREHLRLIDQGYEQTSQRTSKKQIHGSLKGLDGVNDPSAGSPTETLLRLLLPLNDQICTCSPETQIHREPEMPNPRNSLNRSIGSSDGRCVQRAGT